MATRRYGVRIDKPQPRWFEVGIVERGFARAIRPSVSDDDRALVERQAYRRLIFAAMG